MRKTLDITITDEGRDQGKTYRIEEPPAAVQEEWFLRCAFALGRRGVEIPPEVLSMGMAGISYFTVSQLIKLPSRFGLRLSKEIMQYVKIVESKVTRDLVDDDTWEMTTRLRLKTEVLKLAYGFFVDAAIRNLSVAATPSTSQSPQ